jgi:hypothetical protein
MGPILYNYGAKKTVQFRRWSVKRPRHHWQLILNGARGAQVAERSFAPWIHRQLSQCVHRKTWKWGLTNLAFPEHRSQEVGPSIWTKTADETSARLVPFDQAPSH